MWTVAAPAQRVVASRRTSVAATWTVGAPVQQGQEATERSKWPAPRDPGAHWLVGTCMVLPVERPGEREGGIARSENLPAMAARPCRTGNVSSLIVRAGTGTRTGTRTGTGTGTSQLKQGVIAGIGAEAEEGAEADPHPPPPATASAIETGSAMGSGDGTLLTASVASTALAVRVITDAPLCRLVVGGLPSATAQESPLALARARELAGV
mmetsp:Transcript_24107/g.52192  ORF Transcript_24107/g.52192 Transcript_24107/m.52192 type:complete len:210 (-) Transcript_24107:133-762(-)